MTFGIDETGFTLKRLADIAADNVVALSTVQDTVSGEYLTPDLTDENDPLVQVVNAVADSLAVLWEQLQLAYNQFDPLKATGAGLSGLVQLNNLRRKAGSYATTTVTAVGIPNKYIPAGTQISDMEDLYTFNLPGFSFDGSGNATITATSAIKGPVVALAGSLVKILTPISGLTSVVNTDDSTGGTDEETDTELRTRQQASTAGTAKSVIDALYGILAGITGVSIVRVYQNYTLVTDVRGLPGKSVSVVIVGGADADISAAMFSAIPLGLETYGTTITYQTDDQGVSYPVHFTRPDEIAIFVDIEIEVMNASLWPSNGIDLIKGYILAWAVSGASGIGIESGYEQQGYRPGQAVYASELYTAINKQQGIRVESLFIGTSSPATEDTVDIDWHEIAAFDSTNIDITLLSLS